MIPLHLNSFSKIISPSLTSKPHLIFLHDFLCSSLHFSPLTPYLKYNSFFLDLRNHGFSQHTALMNYSLMALDIYSFIKAKKLDNIVLIGHGMGGKALMSFLKNYEEEEFIKGVVIMDIAPKDYLNDRAFSWPAELWILLEDLKFVKLKGMNRQKIKEQVTKIVPNRIYIDLLMSNLVEDEILSDYKWKFDLKHIKENFKELMAYSPKGLYYKRMKLLILGEKSDYVPESCFKCFDELFSDFQKEKEVKYIKNSGHFIEKDQPKELMRLINEFVDSIK